MIKRIIGPEHKNMSKHNEHWLNLDTIAQVEVTSEETAHPIESGLLPNREPGWRPRSQDPRQCVTLAVKRRSILPRNCPPAI